MCASMTSISIPDSVTRIANEAFRSCSSLTSITIPNSVTDLGTWVFYECTSMTNARIGNGVRILDEYLFNGCSNLLNIKISASVTNICAEAFFRCDAVVGYYFSSDSPPSLTGSGWLYYGTNAVVYRLSDATGWPAVPAPWGGQPTALWLPKVADDECLGVQEGQFGFNVDWADSKTVVVEACTNLFATNWVTVATNTLTNGTAYFHDPQWTNIPGRFYRLRSQ